LLNGCKSKRKEDGKIKEIQTNPVFNLINSIKSGYNFEWIKCLFLSLKSFPKKG